MLRLAGESDIGLEKIETLNYAPGVQNTGDLEAGTKTITATAEASGVGNADYSASLTLSAPTDARIAILRTCARFAATIDSMTATHLYARVYIDAQATANRLFNLDLTATGAQLSAADFTSGTIFNLMKDGSAHTFYFFFWVDSGNAVLSVVQLWEGVGSCKISSTRDACLSINHTGLLSFGFGNARVGTGAAAAAVWFTSDSPGQRVCEGITSDGYIKDYTFLCPDVLYYSIYGTVTTDLNYLARIVAIVRRVQ